VNGPRIYVDTSALAVLLRVEPPRDALITWLDGSGAELVSGDLLETELRRIAVREGIDQALVTRLLDGVALASLDRAVFRGAGLLPIVGLRSLDALHLETALRLDVSGVLTYDHRLADAAESVGLDVVAPGQ
jgi:uncharacterized protein